MYTSCIQNILFFNYNNVYLFLFILKKYKIFTFFTYDILPCNFALLL